MRGTQARSQFAPRAILRQARDERSCVFEVVPSHKDDQYEIWLINICELMSLCDFKDLFLCLAKCFIGPNFDELWQRPGLLRSLRAKSRSLAGSVSTTLDTNGR